VLHAATEGTGSLTAGGAIFSRLKALGVDYVFANSGTDFPPIIEGLAEAAHHGIDLPRAITIPHEHAALGMAHGYYFMTGKAQAVMLHTNVGLANGAIGAINAATDHVPMLLMSGRTPTMEKGRFGARTVPIGWGQEMRDQTALVREAAKWDYELRFPEQVTEMLDRAHAIANSTPKGPVYLSLPREILSETIDARLIHVEPAMAPALAEPPQTAISRAADRIAGAENPVVFVQRGGDGNEGFSALTGIAEAFAIPVVHYWATQIGIPTDHEMFAGADPEPWISEADVILVVDALAPWSPDIHTPRKDACVIQLGPNPLFSRFPVRSFRADVTIAAETNTALAALAAALETRRATADIEARRRRVTARTRAIRAATLAVAEGGAGPVMRKDFVALALSRAIAGHDATVLSELGVPLEPMTLTAPRSWYQEPFSGGLGWSLPAAMGMKLARPDKLIVATMGDGSYMFANPVACHQIMQAHDIPVLIVVLNNAGWGTVRQSVTGMYPKGYAARANEMPLTGLAPSPKFEMIAAASDAWARRVETADELAEALEEAIRQVTIEKRTALLNVRVM
jgi:Thiamine pyrophosphate-requiring enzymes [acetolactate synthase, pyruvate dehydrogenase (cytochrome), glyoxylate carboligase, phosphonopyruvate decarboxylase]